MTSESSVQEPDQQQADQRGKRLASRTGVVSLMLLVAAAVFATSLWDWIEVELHSSLTASHLKVTGSDAAPAVSSLALVCLAGAITVAIAGPRVRQLVCIVMILAALGMLLSVIQTLLDPAAAAQSQVGQRTGLEQVAADYRILAWPWCCLLAALANMAVSGWALWVSRSWPLRRKYERSSPAAGRSRDEIDSWDALTAGVDPTQD
ncbi:MAG: Trp biosynthesis-associated membrane protein [Rothia sp. (in: high G+C Gram-positive bacteria)]|nr:Trp biosynthesis-associated membrane protein [Rothia sp. (in: high G+C Gram-positive bacteria)]